MPSFAALVAARHHATPTPDRRPVVAVLRDGPPDVAVARHAARRAEREGRPLALVVPLPVAGGAARGEAAAAISARVHPELDRIGASARVCPTTYVDSRDSRRRERCALAAVDRASRRLQAASVLSAAASLTGRVTQLDPEGASRAHTPERISVLTARG